ncbi:MAG: hypothetical protein AB1563_13235, partial [Bacillota bacterium]
RPGRRFVRAFSYQQRAREYKRKIRRRSCDRHPVGEEKPEEELMGEGFGTPAPSRCRFPRLFFRS